MSPHSPNCTDSKGKLKREKDYENPSESKKKGTSVGVVYRRFRNAINPMSQEDGEDPQQQRRPVVELNRDRIRHTIGESQDKPIGYGGNQKYKADKLEQSISR